MIQKIFIEARHFAGARYTETNKVCVVLCFFVCLFVLECWLLIIFEADIMSPFNNHSLDKMS